MSNRQDRQGARTPADVERRLGVDRKIEEVRFQASEAQRAASSVEQTNKGLEMRVKSLESAVDGTFALEIVEEEGKRYSQLRSDVDKVMFKSNEISIDSDNFSLSEDGEITAKKGTLGGWTLDEYGIHQAHGVQGTYTITSTTTGTNIVTGTHQGWMFYCLESGGIYCYICKEDSFAPEASDGQPNVLWRGDMLGNHRISATYNSAQPS